MITLDTSGLLALIDDRDPDHGRCLAALEADGGPYLIPVPILAEIAYFLEHRFTAQQEAIFLADCRDSAYRLVWHGDEIDRIGTLVSRYLDLPLGVADAAVVACAERHGGHILSVDSHFSVVARGEYGLKILPDL